MADYSQNRASVTVILPGASFPQVRASAGPQDQIGADVEGARGGRGHDLLVGNAKDNLLDGGAGDDQVQGGGGVDRLRGGSGRDLVVSRDGVPDAVRCGTRPDLALIDAEDEVVAALSDQCERVDGGGSGAGRGAVRIGPARGCFLPMRPPGARRWFLLGTQAALPARSLVDASACAARIPGVAVLRRGAFGVFARGGRAHVRLRGSRPCRRLDVTAGARALVVHAEHLITRASTAAWSVSEGCAGAPVRVRSRAGPARRPPKWAAPRARPGKGLRKVSVRRGLPAVLGLMLVVLLIGAPDGWAARAAILEGTLFFAGEPGEHNNAAIRLEGAAYRVTDSAVVAGRIGRHVYPGRRCGAVRCHPRERHLGRAGGRQ